jgi:hypothetical protein
MPDATRRDARDAAGAVCIVLGTGDIASAVAWQLHRAGHGVLLLRDGTTPVLRCGMAFDDALELGRATLKGVTARPQPWPGCLPSALGPLVSRDNLAVALAGFPAGAVALLVDARLRKYAEAEDLRPLARLAIGIGPGFVAGANVHVAVESLPGAEGQVVAVGPTAMPSGRAVPLGEAGSERFVYAPLSGPWTPCRELGERVASGDLLGILGGQAVTAPIAGTIRGLVRERTQLPRGTKLIEIDPRADAAWQGIAPRPYQLAQGVMAAIAVAEAMPSIAAG